MRIVFVSTMRLVRETVSAALACRTISPSVEPACLDSLDPAALAPTDKLLVSAPVQDGLAIVHRVRAMHPLVTIAVLATSLCDSEFIAWAGVGIAGYIEADASAEHAAATMLRIADGETIFPAALSALLLRVFAHRNGPTSLRAALSSLTRRETEVIELVADGLSNKHIAWRLSITDATVKNHVHSILEKFGVPSRGAAAATFRRFAAGPGPAPIAHELHPSRARRPGFAAA